MKKIISMIIVSFFSMNMLFAYEEINIVGSTTVLPIAQASAEAYMDMNPDVDISVRGGGSGVGAAALIDGRCDIADCSRPLKDKEITKAVAKGVSPQAHVVAMDGIAVIVHPSNSLKNITKEDLKAIYTGKVSSWKAFGGPDKEIVVVSRDTASGTYEAFNKLALSKAKVRPDALLEASNKAVATVVRKTPGAIGYIGLAYLIPSVKAVTVEGVVCSEKTVLSGKYPLSRPLFMYTNGAPKGAVKKFLDFLLSDKGQAIVSEVGYIGLK
jgi:phosphate transport system substrate-binding protein